MQPDERTSLVAACLSAYGVTHRIGSAVILQNYSQWSSTPFMLTAFAIVSAFAFALTIGARKVDRWRLGKASLALAGAAGLLHGGVAVAVWEAVLKREKPGLLIPVVQIMIVALAVLFGLTVTRISALLNSES